MEQSNGKRSHTPSNAEQSKREHSKPEGKHDRHVGKRHDIRRNAFQNNIII